MTSSQQLPLVRPGMQRRDAMRALIGAFESAGIDDAALDARLLLCAAALIDPVDLIRAPDAHLDEGACQRLEHGVRRRVAREPISRILGTRGFWSLDLLITPDVLDPRPDSETLIDAALEFFVDRQKDALRIADLGTGSGALICALLDVFPAARGVAIDISPKACGVARCNLARLGFSGRCKVIHGDWSLVGGGGFDLIVANPPYIPSGEIASLSPEVRNFDPRIALDGGSDGLDAYRRLAALLPEALAAGTLVILEIGHDQAARVTEIIKGSTLTFISIKNDYAGRPRAILAVARDKN